MAVGTFPAWLHTLAIISISVGMICAITIALDEMRRPQKMWIMNLVWPLTALFGSVAWTLGYYIWGRGMVGDQDKDRKAPFPIMVAKGSSHCGAGCTLGDIVAEWAAFAVPSIAVWFGWHSIFDEKTFAVLSCPLLSGPSTMRVWIEEGTTNAKQEADTGADHRQAA